jgi:hypothetical protein
VRDRPIYCLFYATRHERGILVFRDCQAALKAQSKTRALTKVAHEARSSGQSEFFQSLHEMGPDETQAFLAAEREKARALILERSPQHPQTTTYKKLWPLVLSQHVVRLTDVNRLCSSMRKSGEPIFRGWEERKRVPNDRYELSRP